MKKREPVSHIMTDHVVSVEESEPLRKALEVVKQNNIRHIPVTKGTTISGMISSTDLNRLTFGHLFESQENADEAVLDMLSIPQVMSHNPKIVNSSTPIRDVAEIFASEAFHSLPVVDNDKLVGIVTTTDVVKYLLDQY